MAVKKNPKRVAAAERRWRKHRKAKRAKREKLATRPAQAAPTDRAAELTRIAINARTCPWCGNAPKVVVGDATTIKCVHGDCAVRPSVSNRGAPMFDPLEAWNARTTKGAYVAADETWSTRDGRSIPVWEMDEVHVRNTLRMVIRKRRQLELARTRSTFERMFDFDPTHGDPDDDFVPGDVR